MIYTLCVDLASKKKDAYDFLYEKASRERKQRADRYRRQEDKMRCVTADALLRTVLGTDDFCVAKHDGGKPYILNQEGFYYNLSHSGRYVVIAWGDSEVGIDVQQQNDSVNIQSFAKRFFANDEQVYICGDRSRFYEIWTKKESYLKYTGEGLRKELSSFSVLAPEDGIRYHHRTLEGGYSLSLCTTDTDYTFERLNVQQLL